MKKYLYADGQKIEYEFVRKRVKNINLRINSKGIVTVSANVFVPESLVEKFVESKSDFIFRALEKHKERADVEPVEHYTEEEVIRVIESICRRVYPFFEKRGVDYPEIKFKNLVSRWGSCHTTKGILTFNTKLRYADESVIEYVVLHEFTHFLQPDHSVKFYGELSKTCPDWKDRRNKLKTIDIRKE